MPKLIETGPVDEGRMSDLLVAVLRYRREHPDHEGSIPPEAVGASEQEMATLLLMLENTCRVYDGMGGG